MMGLEKGADEGATGDYGWGGVGDKIIAQGLKACTFPGSGAPSFAPGQEAEGSRVKEPLRLRCNVAVWTW